MEETDIKLVQDSFSKVVPIADTAAELFYVDLFETVPAVKPMFDNADMADQGKKLMTTIGVVVSGLRDLPKIVPVAEKLAVDHVDFGVMPDHYDAVGASLLRTLEKGLGDDFTPDVKDAWTTAYTTLASVMKAAAYPEVAE